MDDSSTTKLQHNLASKENMTYTHMDDSSTTMLQKGEGNTLPDITAY